MKCLLLFVQLVEHTKSKPGDACSSLMLKEEDSFKARLSADASSYAPPLASLKSHDKGSSPSEQPEVEVSLKAQRTAQSSNSCPGHSRSASSNSEIGIAESTSEGPRISASSSRPRHSSSTSSPSILVTVPGKDDQVQFSWVHCHRNPPKPICKEFKTELRQFLLPGHPRGLLLQCPMDPSTILLMCLLFRTCTACLLELGLDLLYLNNQTCLYLIRVPATQAYFPPGAPQMMFGHLLNNLCTYNISQSKCNTKGGNIVHNLRQVVAEQAWLRMTIDNPQLLKVS
ncbi:hypothetical protein Leryth_012584 [Lithospermum erythrorhizon]|nr:hypothetical protein Leryth_012584 [Lithospermum erythrorhizon]